MLRRVAGHQRGGPARPGLGSPESCWTTGRCGSRDALPWLRP